MSTDTLPDGGWNTAYICNSDNPLQSKAFICTDRDSIGFGLEFGSGTVIGTIPQESLLIQNRGSETLKISSANVSGDAAFTIEGPASLELKANQKTFIRIFFKPTAEKAYSAAIDIASNAANAPTKSVGLRGRGCKPGASCPDAGM